MDKNKVLTDEQNEKLKKVVDNVQNKMEETLSILKKDEEPIDKALALILFSLLLDFSLVFIKKVIEEGENK